MASLRLKDLLGAKKILSMNGIVNEAFSEKKDRYRMMSKISREAPELTVDESEAIENVLVKYGVKLTRIVK